MPERGGRDLLEESAKAAAGLDRKPRKETTA
jgi:hypothetical protein